MSSLKQESSGHTYWRSLDELVRTPEFQEAVAREFPNDDWDRLPEASRRSFLKVMGASMAFAGLTACRWPAEEIVPFAHRPEGRVPGVPEKFATAFETAGTALGMVVTSYDGRPVKAEGNPRHPDSLGALSATGQAMVLEMYDPDRSRRLIQREGGKFYGRSWDEFAAEADTLFSGTGSGVAVLAEASSSPSLRAMAAKFGSRFPDAAWYEWSPLANQAEEDGARMAFGVSMRPVPRLDKAKVIAAFDADFLNDHPASLCLTRKFAAGRRPVDGEMNRLWVAEPAMSGTGAMADHRIAVAHASVPAILASVVHRLVERHHLAVPGAADALIRECGAAALAEEAEAFARDLADDLVAHPAGSLLMVGRRQPAEVHALAVLVNRSLGNVGRTVDFVVDGDAENIEASGSIEDLAAAISAGGVETLLILGGNPVYTAPADLLFGDAVASVDTSIHLSMFQDETSLRSTWHLPMAHAFEAWGDGRAWDGTLTTAQPLIAPLYDGRSLIEVLATVMGEEVTVGYDIVRRTLKESGALGMDFEKGWRRALHDGVVPGTAWVPSAPSVSRDGAKRAADGLRSLLAAKTPGPNAPELLLAIDPKILDGRFANNGWLQELPEALTKITWDNALLMSPATARDLGLEDGDLVAVAGGGKIVELPVYVMPGQARSSMTAWLGYGRTAAGQVGNGVGANLFALRTTADPWVVDGVEIRPLGRKYRLATTQDHWAIDTIGFEARQGRIGNLVREANLDEYLAHPETLAHMDHHPPLISLWKEKVYEGDQWGMAIDLNSCTGCNACVMACTAENNIPVVGREQVLNQREMHWIRLDRYFKTPIGVGPDDVDDAGVAFQPMTCVHCENAPCEQVCPVAATQHTADGLNSMVYNRCVGTRYCANNCPFKVRRFNFFNYHKDLAEISKMQFNPEVTVRSRGVMEKCSLCIQRIQQVRIEAGNENRPIRDGEITTACAQTCPAEAIHFGNINDPDSAVSKLRESDRSYHTLAELNIKPRIHYMARLRNPAGDEADAPASAPDHGPDTSHGKESA